MTRVLTYNILLGGHERVAEIAALIEASKVDLVGLAEASNPATVEELARRLGMQHCMSGRGRNNRDWQVAFLSRLPIVRSEVHARPGVFGRRYLLEVEVEQANGEHLVIFVIHLTSDFFYGPRSNRLRRREVQELLQIASARQAVPHLIMGDFNSIKDGEEFRFSALVRYLRTARLRQGRPLKFKRRRIRFLYGLMWMIGYNKLLAPLADHLSRQLIKGGIDLMEQAGYVDSFRALNATSPGFTFHAAEPACRIDYIFASPQMASRLNSCMVVTEGNGIAGHAASDHLPVLAEFAE
jgi:endonuclease/exonuclease/phosphatase family metal-dependent hydrolase